MSFLNINNNMTMWVPRYKKIRKVSSQNKENSFMNSDLSFEDLDIRNIDEYKYIKSSKNEFYNEIECYVITSTPKEKKSSIYLMHKTWISKDVLKPLREISFDKDNNPFKEKIFSYTKINNLDVIESLIVKNLQTKTHTKLYIDDIELDTDLNEDYFKEINLKRIPK